MEGGDEYAAVWTSTMGESGPPWTPPGGGEPSGETADDGGGLLPNEISLTGLVGSVVLPAWGGLKVLMWVDMLYHGLVTHYTVE
jgi:hypothetical protein